MKSILTLITSVILTHVLFSQINCANDSTGRPSLYDIGAGFYNGEQGNLYPGGSLTITPAHFTGGSSVIKKMKKLDTMGVYDPVNGQLVFVSIGASFTSDAWNNFTPKALATANYNPCLSLINATVGGKGYDYILDSITGPNYWSIVDGKLDYASTTAAQVQVAWMCMHTKNLEADTIWPDYRDSTASQMTKVIQALKVHFPNLKLLYISGIHYGGYTDTLNEFYKDLSEPAFYYNNSAVKKVVESQISGDPALKYKGLGINAPWIAWGPYFWADGKNPRAIDSLSWNCSEYRLDGGGYHLNTPGRDKEGDMMEAFFTSDPSAIKWFFKGPKWKNCDGMRNADGSEAVVVSDNENQKIIVFPNPASNKVSVIIPDKNTNTSIQMFNSMGQKVYDASTDQNYLELDVTSYTSGYYVLIADNGKHRLQQKICVQH